MSQTVYLSLGSNLGDRAQNLRLAVHELENVGAELRTSRIYETAPMYVSDQPRFLNMVVRMAASVSPSALLEAIHGVEAGLGRDRSSERRMGPRTMDIDILLYGDQTLSTPHLTIPHPRMKERAFVLIPLLELEPEAREPLTLLPYRQVLSGLSDKGVWPWSPPGQP